MANELNRLRAEVLRAQKLTSDKISRTLKNTGANVSGSQFDPRRDPSKVMRYNKKQLETYLGQLNSFRDRNVQFVSGAKGAPIPKHLATRYESVMRTYNRLSRREFSAVENVRLLGGGTIGQRERDFDPEGRSYGARASNRPRGRFDVDVSKVTGVEGLQKLETMMRRKMSDSHKRNSIKAQRFQMGELFAQIGEPDLMELANELSDDQFNALWNYTDFAETVSGRYEAAKNMSVEEQSRTSDEFRGEMIDVLQWAKTIK